MTRAEVLANYTVENGIITDMGEFCGKPPYIAAYWKLYRDFESNRYFEDDDEVVFPLGQEDWKEWPELEGRKELRLYEDGEGYVQEM